MESRLNQTSRAMFGIVLMVFCCLTGHGCVAEKQQPPTSGLRGRKVTVETDLNPGAPRASLPAPAPVPNAAAKARLKPAALPPRAAPTTLPAVRPVSPIRGTVLSANPELRFAVVDFNSTRFPAAGQTMHLYRNGEKIGAIRINGPFLNGNAVGDVIEGEAAVGDEVHAARD